LELEIAAGTLGGRFTTLEGLLSALQEQMTESNPLFLGDSSDVSVKAKFKEVADAIGRILSGETLPTVVLDDPAGNSYLQVRFTSKLFCKKTRVQNHFL
jgi:zinc finger protein